MLEKTDFTTSDISKEEYKLRHKELVEKIVLLQQKARSESIGLVAFFEGYPLTEKGEHLTDLMCNLDARATNVYDLTGLISSGLISSDVTKNSIAAGGSLPMAPLAQFWEGLGQRDEFTFYLDGTYTYTAGLSLLRAEGDIEEALRLSDAYVESIAAFERQLAADGYIVLKFFFNKRRKTIKRAFKAITQSKEVDWNIRNKTALGKNAFKKYKRLYDSMMEKSEVDFSPWIVLNAENYRETQLTIEETIAQALENALAAKVASAEAPAEVTNAATESDIAEAPETAAEPEVAGDAEATKAPEASAVVSENAVAKQAEAPKESRFPICEDYPRFENLKYDLVCPREEYKVQLKALQKKLSKLQLQAYLKRVPVVVMYEGWDAAGKGGNIKRLAQALDARGYSIVTSPAPTKPELMHPFLWRYWTQLPVAGTFGLFDRSWYGRVLVERVEGFAKPDEWSRAYDEINEFEKDLVDWGAVLVKFWVEIDQDEQLVRFKARQENPEKTWKITDEDWRNREKYPQYRTATEDMFRLTSTTYAPWTVLESNDKCYARIKALETVIDALEKKLASL